MRSCIKIDLMKKHTTLLAFCVACVMGLVTVYGQSVADEPEKAFVGTWRPIAKIDESGEKELKDTGEVWDVEIKRIVRRKGQTRLSVETVAFKDDGTCEWHSPLEPEKPIAGTWSREDETLTLVKWPGMGRELTYVLVWVAPEPTKYPGME